MANYKWKVVFKMNEEYKSDENFENNPEELNNDQTDNNKEVYNNQADSTQEMYNTVNNVQETVNDSVNTQSSGKKKKHKKDRNKRSSFVLVSVAAILTVTVITIGTLFVGSGRSGFLNSTSNKTYDKVSTTNTVDANTNDSKTKVTTTKSDSSSSSTNEAVVTDVSAVVEEVMPSIVAITSTSIVESGFSNDWYDYYFGYGNGNDGGTYEETGAGSGIIIGQSDSELLIVTNNHVVEGADSLQVQFIDEETVDAAIKGTDSSNDLAVVAVKLEDIPEDTMKEIKVATIGDSDALKVGEGTIAIGNALGYGQSVTTGVVSALNREVEYEDGSKKDLIQTDAAINPGNSGGALLNMKGEVIGINAAKYSSSSVEGMGFAIPISNVEDIINKLMNEETKEKVDDEERGYLNINGRDITSTMSEEYNIPVGVYVVNVTKGGAADKAGLQENSVIVGIEGKTVDSMEELQEQLQYYAAGDKITITAKVLEGNEYVEKEYKITLDAKLKD